MTFFSSLYPLAERATLVALITVEDGLLRVNVTPQAAPGDADTTVRPLSLLATAEELDAHFAQAVEVYRPSVLPLLEQAEAAAAANGKKGSKPAALSGPSSKKDDSNPKPEAAPGKRGRKPKQQEETPSTVGDAESGDAEKDPRQLALTNDDAAPQADPSATPIEQLASENTPPVDDESPAPANLW
jgi:PRTRC genetic system protein E